MTTRMRWTGPLLCLLVLGVGTPVVAQTKEKVYRNLSTEQVEKLLNDMGIKPTTSKDPMVQDQYLFDFERNKYKIRLTLYKGETLWLTAYFPKTSLEKINEWNVNAKFGRAVHIKSGDRENAVIEYQLDVVGGATENTFRQFIRRFDGEVPRFDQFLLKS